ncbi:hypothetical protein ACFFQF_07480 [Haladaptatus pallidirubidus]|uniref:hypothetical protein n=1 Tax=Haladaptatus pallidirubidus TaxID=1008152 RepID=UPI0035EB395D
MRTITVVAVALMLVLAGCSSTPTEDTTTSDPDVTNTTQTPDTPSGEKKRFTRLTPSPTCWDGRTVTGTTRRSTSPVTTD